MTIRNLDAMLEPHSLAIVGATDRPGSLGAALVANVVGAGFAGPIWPVNPNHATVAGLPCFPDPAALPAAPDLAVVAIPAPGVPAAIAALGARGCRAAIVVSGGVTGDLRQAMLDAAQPHLLRILGAGSLGLVVPSALLNASLARGGAESGTLGLVSQSGALLAAMVDWASVHGIGISQAIALGDMADVDLADSLDLLARDWRTRAILVCFETVPAARKFLSAARAAARVKPVIALKAGRSPRAALAAATHTGMLSGADAVVDAAMRRAGILRVGGLSEMFAAAETVARFRPMQRARVAIVTNGGGAGVLAVDRLMEISAELAEFSPATLEALLPPVGRSNPVDIVEDASPERYVAILAAVAADPGTDALLVMNCPVAVADPLGAAEAVAATVDRGMIHGKPLLACWIGGDEAREARVLLRARNVASFDTPSTAAAAVGHLTEWGRAQAALLHVPDRQDEAAVAATPAEARAHVAALFARVAAEGRRQLSEAESLQVLAAYGIPAVPTRAASSPEAAATAAADLLAHCDRVAVKLLSREISHKSDFGGVVLDVASPAAAAEAARGIADRVAEKAPGSRLDGFLLQPMVRRREAIELILGVGRDPVFGPVILFGAGGIAVELLGDTDVALPPLDADLAGALVARTRIGRQLAGFRGRRPADAAALTSALVALSHLAEDFPCLRAVDVNPLLADADGVLALDATIEFDPDDLDRPAPNPDLAIRPYPGGWRSKVEAFDGTYQLRPIQPADALLYPDFWDRTDPDDIRRRFLGPRSRFTEEGALRLTQLDYDREVAFVALTPDGALAGVSRIAAEPDHKLAEYSLLVRSDLQGRGLGTALMRLAIDYARADGIEHLEGPVLAENGGMLRLIRRLGFKTRLDPEDASLVVSWLDLVEPIAPAPAAS